MAPVLAAAPLCPPGPPNVAGLHPGAVSRGSCPAGCRVGHFVPHLPTLRPQYWRRGPLLAQTAPPCLRAGSCGSALQGRPRWPAAAAAGAPRPSPPPASAPAASAGGVRQGAGSELREEVPRAMLRACPHAQPAPSSACAATAPRAGGETEAPGSRTSEACGQRRTRSGRGTQLPAPGRGPRPSGGLHSRGPSLQTGLATAKGSEPVPCVSLGRASLSTRPHA